jgi:hypothetical protein
VSGIDRIASVGLEMRVLGADELDSICGGKKSAKTPKAAVRAFDNMVTDAVLTADESATLHDVK